MPYVKFSLQCVRGKDHILKNERTDKFNFITGRNVTSKRFADDTDRLVGNLEELRDLIQPVTVIGSKEICAEKTKLMKNKSEDIETSILI